MAKYVREAGEKAFRKISVSSETIPAFEEFTSDCQVVNYADNRVVLEILLDNGDTKLVYPGAREIITYNCSNNRISISSNAPLARLWAKSNSGCGIACKIPSNLPHDGSAGAYFVNFPAPATGIELFGDEYFDKVYDIQIH